MNPFIESTLATETHRCWWRELRPSAPARYTRAGRRAWRHVLGAMLVTAAVGIAAPAAHALDVNQASTQQLESIRGIGPRTAEVIVNERERGGRFESFEDLAERVRGIGQKKAQALEAAGLTVGEGGAPAQAGAKADVKSEAELAVRPATKSAGRPAANHASNPAANSAANPASKPASKPSAPASARP